eukprot:scaffold205570_cov27-Tisochrysis_lutea.AAC.4
MPLLDRSCGVEGSGARGGACGVKVREGGAASFSKRQARRERGSRAGGAPAGPTHPRHLPSCRCVRAPSRCAPP